MMEQKTAQRVTFAKHTHPLAGGVSMSLQQPEKQAWPGEACIPNTVAGSHMC